MSPFANAFEKRWFCIIMFFYVLIMLPFPFFYNTEYDPSYLGIPSYIFGWLANSVAVVITLFVWRAQCLTRPEYQDEGDQE